MVGQVAPQTNRFHQSKGNRIVGAPSESSLNKTEMAFIVHPYSDSADSHHRPAVAVQLEVDRSHVVSIAPTTLGNSLQFPIRFLQSLRWGQAI